MTGSIGLSIVGGYLGAGKTTFINALLAAQVEPVAVVVNDFGSVNIDAALIARRHDDVIELTNGCICCTIGDSLADTLYSILDRPRRPSSIVVEASGVADPGALSHYGHLSGLHRAGTVVLVDALHAPTTHANALLTRTFERQIVAADALVLTKTDLADADDMHDTLQLLHRLAPTTPVVRASPDLLARIMVGTHDHALDDDPSQAVHVATTWPADHCATDEAWRDLLAAQPVSCVRSKGIVVLADGTHRLIQGVGRHVSITKTDAAPTGVVAIHVRPPSPLAPAST